MKYTWVVMFNKFLYKLYIYLTLLTRYGKTWLKLPPDAAAGEVGGKAVELRSYIDPTKR